MKKKKNTSYQLVMQQVQQLACAYQPKTILEAYCCGGFSLTFLAFLGLLQHVTHLRNFYVCFPSSPQSFPIQAFLPMNLPQLL